MVRGVEYTLKYVESRMQGSWLEVRPQTRSQPRSQESMPEAALVSAGFTSTPLTLLSGNHPRSPTLAFSRESKMTPLDSLPRNI